MLQLIGSKSIAKKIFIAICIIILLLFSYCIYLNYFKYSNTIVIRLTGGLGNQLYQVAFGIALEKKTGVKIQYDTHELDREAKKSKNRSWVRWYFDHLNINAEKWSPNPLEKLIVKNILVNRKCNQNYYDYDGRCFKKQKVYYKKQAFENELYFKEYYPDIRDAFLKLNEKYAHELDEKNQAMIKDMQSHKNSVVINIRLGDFLIASNAELNVCNFDYYKTAMKVFDNMEDVHYYIFSDDIEGVKKYFKTNKPATYVDVNPLEKPYLNLILSASAKHNIVSNSTFAIWAGMLNSNPNKIVVCPDVFYKLTDKKNPNSEWRHKYGKIANENIFPKEWIKIDTTNDKPIEIGKIDTKFSESVKDAYSKNK